MPHFIVEKATISGKVVAFQPQQQAKSLGCASQEIITRQDRRGARYDLYYGDDNS